MTTHEITLRAMRFHALVGILPHERELAQPIEIDVTARLGDGEGIVDYRRMYEAAASVFSAGPIDYLERSEPCVQISLACPYLSRVQRFSLAIALHLRLFGQLYAK